jgi:hypothetical protein
MSSLLLRWDKARLAQPLESSVLQPGFTRIRGPMALWPGWLSLIEEGVPPFASNYRAGLPQQGRLFCGFIEDKICDESATIEALPFFGLLSE